MTAAKPSDQLPEDGPEEVVLDDVEDAPEGATREAARRAARRANETDHGPGEPRERRPDE